MRKRLVAERLRSGELVELKLDPYPFTDWRVGLDMIWAIDAKPGVVATWLKAALGRTPVAG